MRNKQKIISAVSLSALALVLAVGFASAEDRTDSNIGKFECKKDINGKEVCVRQDGATKLESDVQMRIEKQKELREHLKKREEKGRAIRRLAQNQIERAQKAIEKLTRLDTRIKAQRTKLATVATAAELAAVDAQITKSENLKKAVDTALAEVVAKSATLGVELKKAETETVLGMDIQNQNPETSDIPTLKPAPTQTVKEFMKSVESLKKQIIAWHKSMQQTVKLMKKAVERVEKEQTDEDENEDDSSTTPTPAPSPVEQTN